MITVRDLMNLDIFRSITLAAGKRGLHRRVSWPNIAQTVSIREWLIGGDVIFMTGIGLNCTTAFLNDVIHQAVEGDAACLIIFLYDNFIPQIPQDTVEYADQIGFPLFSGKWDIRFAELIRDISSLILTDQYGENVMNEMLEMLLFRHETLPREMAASLVEKYHLNGKHRVLLAECRWDLGYEQKRQEEFRLLRQINHMLLQECRGYFHDICYINRNSRMIFLIGEEPGEAMKRFLQEVQTKARGYFHRARLAFGIGNVYSDPAQLHRSYQEAEKALNLGSTEEITAFSQLGIFQLLMEVPDQGLVRTYAKAQLEPLIAYDMQYQKNLLQTLEIYLATNCNYVKTAQQMYVHRNTLAYKIDKIKELLDLPIEQAEVRNHLFNCIKVYHFCK